MIEDTRGRGIFWDRKEAIRIAEFRAKSEGTVVDYTGCYNDEGKPMWVTPAIEDDPFDFDFGIKADEE